MHAFCCCERPRIYNKGDISTPKSYRSNVDHPRLLRSVGSDSEGLKNGRTQERERTHIENQSSDGVDNREKYTLEL
ncbi:hypothetical protein C1H46_044274 [Malus baccata]|uniref:Uncharacterized protein n=1 Tax=Malus baccata TaxID=106549 RepID=A0A540K7L7_MALBA|nr:hypothetical protein C1H46_044274 [Malus baccata]